MTTCHRAPSAPTRRSVGAPHRCRCRQRRARRPTHAPDRSPGARRGRQRHAVRDPSDRSSTSGWSSRRPLRRRSMCSTSNPDSSSDAARRRTRRARSLGPVSLSTSRGRRSHRRQRRSARSSTPAPGVEARAHATARVPPGNVAHRGGRSGWRPRRRGGRHVSPPPRSPSRRTHRTLRARRGSRRRLTAQPGPAPADVARTTPRNLATGWHRHVSCSATGTPPGTPPPPPARRRSTRRCAPPRPSRCAPSPLPSRRIRLPESTAGTADYRAFRETR